MIAAPWVFGAPIALALSPPLFDLRRTGNAAAQRAVRHGDPHRRPSVVGDPVLAARPDGALYRADPWWLCVRELGPRLSTVSAPGSVTIPQSAMHRLSRPGRK